MLAPDTRPPPRSCDTFVCVRAATGGVGPACTLFGKNSDRPSEEAHEVGALTTARDANATATARLAFAAAASASAAASSIAAAAASCAGDLLPEAGAPARRCAAVHAHRDPAG